MEEWHFPARGIASIFVKKDFFGKHLAIFSVFL